MRKINQAGLDLIKRNEGLRTTAYQDVVGVWTIGYGHTGPSVLPDLIITEGEAEILLEKDLERFEQGVTAQVTVPLTDNQFSALVSFAFNLGLGNLKSSTLLKKLNAGQYGAAAAEFLKWNRAGGKVYPGLTKRRQEEQALFLTA